MRRQRNACLRALSKWRSCGRSEVWDLANGRSMSKKINPRPSGSHWRAFFVGEGLVKFGTRCSTERTPGKGFSYLNFLISSEPVTDERGREISPSRPFSFPAVECLGAGHVRRCSIVNVVRRRSALASKCRALPRMLGPRTADLTPPSTLPGSAGPRA